MTPSKSQSKRSRRIFLGAALLILLAVFIVTWRNVGPAAPREIVILSGEPGTSHYEYGKQYVAFLDAKGLDAHLAETAGSLENLKRLSTEDRPAVGLVLSGVERELDDQNLVADLFSLGSIGLEPFWVFVRTEDTISSIRDLAGRRVALGPKGSGSRATALLLLEDNGIENDVEVVSYKDQSPEELATDLSAGRIDAACLVGPPSAPFITRLLQTEGLAPLSLERTAAYARRHPGLERLMLPMGAYDVARNIPSVDLDLVAPSTNLVAGAELHPAAVALLLEGAKEIHRTHTLFATQGAFPSSKYVSLPLSPAAAQYFSQGQGFIYKVLPFRWASLLTWLVTLLTPIATVAFFLFKAVPGMLKLRWTMRLQRYYRRLQRLEQEAMGASVETKELLRELEAMREETANIRVPLPLAASYLEFRQNIHDARERFETAQQLRDEAESANEHDRES